MHPQAQFHFGDNDQCLSRHVNMAKSIPFQLHFTCEVRSLCTKTPSWNLSGRELGDRLGSFRNGVLGQFSRQHETNRGLDLSTGKGRLLVVGGQLASFGGNPFENIVNERVHNGHSLLGNSSIRVDLLEDLVDVGRVGLGTLLGLGLAGGGLLGSLGGLLGGGLGHGCGVCVNVNESVTGRLLSPEEKL